VVIHLPFSTEIKYELKIIINSKHRYVRSCTDQQQRNPIRRSKYKGIYCKPEVNAHGSSIALCGIDES
jgi:hypothetical protein